MDDFPPSQNETNYSTEKDKNPVPPATSGESAQNEPVPEAAKGKRRNKRKINWRAWIQAISAALIVIITGFYTYYASIQANKMKEEVRTTGDAFVESKRSNELIQRAWVLVESITIDEPIPNKILLLGVEEKNYGRSPASKVTVWAGPKVSRIDPGQFEPKATYERHVISSMLAGPGKVWFSHFNVTLSEADIQEIKGGATLYIVGRITYVDPFFEISHEIRETDFCAYVSGKDIVACPNGNSAR